MKKTKNCVFSFDLFRNASDDRLSNVKVKSERRFVSVISVFFEGNKDVVEERCLRLIG